MSTKLQTEKIIIC